MKKYSLVLAMLLPAAGGIMAEGPSRAEIADKVIGIAKFKTGEVNLRQSPSTYAPYLVIPVGEELFYSPEDIQWSVGMGTGVKYEKRQAFQEETMPLLAKEDGWVKLYFSNGSNPFEVWTMEKFVDVTPIVDLTSTTSFPQLEGSMDSFTLMQTPNGEVALYFAEPGMDEDEPTLRVGKKIGKTVVLDRNVAVSMNYDSKKEGWSVRPVMKPGDVLVLTYGPDACDPKGNEYMGRYDFRQFTPQLTQSLYDNGTPAEVPGIVIAGEEGNGYIF